MTVRSGFYDDISAIISYYLHTFWGAVAILEQLPTRKDKKSLRSENVIARKRKFQTLPGCYVMETRENYSLSRIMMRSEQNPESF